MGINLLTNWLLELMYATASPFYTLYAFFIQTTLYVSVTALFIILFKLLFKNRLKARWHFLIWAVLLIRLVVPVLPSSPVSVFNTVKVDESVIEQSSFQTVVSPPDNDNVDPDEDHYTVAEGLQKMVETDQSLGFGDFQGKIASGYTITIDAIVTYVWLGGTIILLGYFITVLAVYRHKLQKTRREYENLALLDKCKEQLHIRRKVQVYYADTTPVLIGLFKPAIYVPDNLSQSELEATLLHELNHLKHLDILWSAIATVVLCVNWFNPIIWLSFFMFKRDLEVYCDERTLRYAENKQSYAMLLLKTATARKERFVLGTTSLQSGKADVKRRIRFMAKYKKPTVALTIIAVIFASVLTATCLTNSRSTDMSTQNPITNSDFEVTSEDSSVKFCRSDLTFDELRETIFYPERGFSVVKYGDDEFLAGAQGAQTLYSRNIYGTDGKRLENAYVMAENRRLIDDDTYIAYPYHLAQNRWMLSKNGNGYRLIDNANPFKENVTLKTAETAFSDLVRYYAEQDYSIRYEGDNISGGIIFATSNSYSGDSFRILVTKNGKDFLMRYKANNNSEVISEKISGVNLSYSSSLYTKSDFENAATAVNAEFSLFGSGAGTLYALTYKGDDYSENELDYCNKLKENNETLYTECMVFGSLFHTEKNANGAWNPDSDYTWEWYLARSNGGEWKVVSYGY